MARFASFAGFAGFAVAALVALVACRDDAPPKVRADDVPSAKPTTPPAESVVTVPSLTASPSASDVDAEDTFPIVLTRTKLLVDGVEAPRSEIPIRAAARVKAKPGLTGIVIAAPDVPFADIKEVTMLLTKGGIVSVRYMVLHGKGK